MSMETFSFMSIDDAITVLTKLKKITKKNELIIFMVNLDNNSSEKKSVSYDDSFKMIRSAKTIINNNDDFMQHIELLSTVQDDIMNIKPIGIMHDIYVPHYKKNESPNKRSVSS